MRRAVPFLLAALVALVIFEVEHHRVQRNSVAPAAPVSASAPDLLLKDLDGNQINTGKYRGRIVLVNFWAAWCVPCAQEIPEFMKLEQKFGSKLQVIGISIDDNENELRAFYKNHNMDYPVVRGDQQIADGYGGVPGLPTTYIIDQENHIWGRQVGSTDFQKLQEQISSLLK